MSTFRLAMPPQNFKKPFAIAIGSSTGGPEALKIILNELASLGGVSQPMFITQHIPLNFAEILAQSLKKSSKLNVKSATDGETVRPQTIYIAPGGKHLVVKRDKAFNLFIYLDDGPPVNFCKPSVDIMFESIVTAYHGYMLAVVLTGIGVDGAAGAEIVYANKGLCIAQDKKTSVIWGMPGATAMTNKCYKILPLQDIALSIKNISEGRLD